MSNNIKPQIFIPDEGNSKTLIDVKLERHDSFDILWFHWPQDGWFFFVEDYEPVILVYSPNGTLCYLIVRRHWEYKFYSLDELSDPVQVLFDGSFHPPFARTKEDGVNFDEKKMKLLPKNYDDMIKLVNPNDIDEKFRTGKGHPTSAGRTMEDPVDVANEIRSEQCGNSS